MRLFRRRAAEPVPVKSLAEWGTDTGSQPGSVSAQTNERVRQAMQWAMSLGPAEVWNTQPYVRTVVEFLARNIAQLGLHTFRRVDDEQRVRDRDSALSAAIRRPNASTTTYELLFGLVCDKALYARAYWLIGTSKRNGSPTLTRIPPSRVVAHTAVDPLGEIDTFRVLSPRGESVDIPAANILYFPGWNPTTSVGLPTSPLDAVRSVIAEQAAAFEFRKLAWANGGQITGSIERPAGATWRDGARDRFIADLRSQFGGDGPRRGGILLLEDGMKLNTQQFNAKEAEWIDAAKLSLALVASIYHVNPTMVGLLDNANYSNVREFRRMLYGDTLGPIMADIEDRINAFLIPRLVPDADGSGDGSTSGAGELYVEFNIGEKLQGSFEEQAAALQTSVGGPWMLRSEARSRLNLPPIDGADELIVPMNVTAGGQASPTDSAPPVTPVSAASAGLTTWTITNWKDGTASKRLSPVADIAPKIKRRATQQQTARVTDTLRTFFDRQSRAVLSRIGADPSSDDWWNADRWNGELADALHDTVVDIVGEIGVREAAALGYDGDFDVQRAEAFIRSVAERYAGNINDTTRQQLVDTLASDDPDADPAHVFDVAHESRAPGAALMLTTFAAGFAAGETARQIGEQHDDVEPTKTWITGPNPRASHAGMNGETVGIDEPFSNGMQWPAESGDVDEVAGCNCSVQIDIPDRSA